ncbi:MAG: DUF5110 domain-containing protein [Anaerolineae bacterium]|nr:DUF5110 domain-containing protein [Anaerolineae bacterium]
MQQFKLAFAPIARSESIAHIGQARFTLLTTRLIRMEFSPTGVFEDRATQAFWYRDQPTPAFTVTRDQDQVVIETEYLKINYQNSPAGFSTTTLTIELKALGRTWYYGQPNPNNLLGTARTLDGVSGQTVLEPGLISRDGWAMVDDSQRLVFDDQGWLQNRPANDGYLDLYFFGYGHDYQACLSDYMQITGPIALLPRFALGNWWSRYWEYTQPELTGLMNEFKAQAIPLSVCIVDMDWHITQTGNQSRGWTGYTWNRALFPDPKAFIDFLHLNGLKTALNLHPADGVHPHEDLYEAIRERLGGESGQPVKFQIADPAFAQAYFEVLHHPFEDQGVDFWWMDWQQGTQSGKSGLDPLWWLNHLHFYDLARTGEKRPFIFSRWGGLGNHRYPIGFSGDTVVSWESLAYQPYFTATAANVGYGWWSHDIGGHFFGTEDAELYTRWVQYGLFSPIFRLHSTKNPYHERLPWGYDAETFRIAGEAMRLRHAFIPYLYAMSWRAYRDRLQPIVPMYHEHSEREEAYHCPNQYTFGSELIAAPHISPIDPLTQMSRQVVWLPEGEWYDFFTGEAYHGDTWNAIYGQLADIPVFAKAGAIIPLAEKVAWGGIDNPETLDVYIFPGADRRFELYEDDGESNAYLNDSYSITPMTQQWHPEQLIFTIAPVTGQSDHLPQIRKYRLHLRGVRSDVEIDVRVQGDVRYVESQYHTQTETLSLGEMLLSPSDRLVLTVTHPTDLRAKRDRRWEKCERMLRNFKLDSITKRLIGEHLPAIVQDVQALAPFTPILQASQLQMLLEVLTGVGATFIQNAAPEQQPLIIWNNQQADHMRYRLVTRRGWHFDLQSGVIPKFKVIDTKHLEEWHLQVLYGDLFVAKSHALKDSATH